VTAIRRTACRCRRDRVVVRQVATWRPGAWSSFKRRLCTSPASHPVRADVARCPASRPLRHGAVVGHGLDVAVGGIVRGQNFCHDGSPWLVRMRVRRRVGKGALAPCPRFLARVAPTNVGTLRLPTLRSLSRDARRPSPSPNRPRGGASLRLVAIATPVAALTNTPLTSTLPNRRTRYQVARLAAASSALSPAFSAGASTPRRRGYRTHRCHSQTAGDVIEFSESGPTSERFSLPRAAGRLRLVGSSHGRADSASPPPWGRQVYSSDRTPLPSAHPGTSAGRGAPLLAEAVRMGESAPSRT